MRASLPWQVRRLLMTFLIQLGILFGITTHSGRSAEFFVTSVIREVPLKTSDPHYKDFYINAGTNNGLKKGVIIDAVRKMGVYDNINSKLIGDTTIRIARMKLIHVDKSVSIARLVKFYEKESTPLSGFDSVMIGDLVEVADGQ